MHRGGGERESEGEARQRDGRASLQVLVVDDSALVRQALTGILSRDPAIEVESASDPIIALRKMARSRPNVVVLDLTMPRMDGFEFLRKVMAEDPLPVVVFSAVAQKGSAAALRALDEGAVGVLAKPEGGLEEAAPEILRMVREAASARVRRRGLPPPATGQPGPGSQAASVARHDGGPNGRPLIAVGASMGGPDALRRFLGALPADAPAIAIVQHMPIEFTGALAARLDACCQIEVREACEGDWLVPGTALIAPGDRHMRVRGRPGRYYASLGEDASVSGHRPSVDVLLQSAAVSAGGHGIGVILTGMGRDGAVGLRAMRNAGARTLAQSEDTCVVFGMPRQAIAEGGVDEVLPLHALPRAALEAAGRL